MVRLNNIPTIEIDWDIFKDLDEVYVEDLTSFNILVLTLVKEDVVKLVAYDIEEKKWALLEQ
jgi:DNA-directed RNA polymerase subunit L